MVEEWKKITFGMGLKEMVHALIYIKGSQIFIQVLAAILTFKQQQCAELSLLHSKTIDFSVEFEFDHYC